MRLNSMPVNFKLKFVLFFLSLLPPSPFIPHKVLCHSDEQSEEWLLRAQRRNLPGIPGTRPGKTCLLMLRSNGTVDTDCFVAALPAKSVFKIESTFIIANALSRKAERTGIKCRNAKNNDCGFWIYERHRKLILPDLPRP